MVPMLQKVSNNKYDISNIDNSEFGPSGRLNLWWNDMDDDEKYSEKQ